MFPPPSAHSWEAERLTMDGGDQVGPGRYAPKEIGKRVPTFRYGYKLPFFTNGPSSRVDYATEREMMNKPGPGRYFQKVKGVHLPVPQNVAPFNLSGARFGEGVDGALGRSEILQTDHADEARNVIKENKKMVRHRESEEEKEEKKREKEKHREIVKKRHALSLRMSQKAKENAISGRMKAVEIRRERAAASVAEQRWLYVCIRSSISDTIQWKLTLFRFSERMKQSNRLRAIILIQRYTREWLIGQKDRKKMKKFFKSHLPLFMIKSRIHNKRKAASLLRTFFSDFKDKACYVRPGAPKNILFVMKSFLKSVAKVQKFWRQAYLRNRAQLCLFIHQWHRVHDSPKYCSTIRSLRNSLHGVSDDIPMKGKNSNPLCGSCGTTFIPPPGSGTYVKCTCGKDVHAPRDVEYSHLLEDLSDGVSLEVKVKLLSSVLRDLRRSHHRSLIKHSKGMKLFIQKKMASTQDALQFARDELRGVAMTTRERKEKVFRDQYLRTNPAPFFCLLKGFSEKQMLSVIIKGYKEQSTINSRQWMMTGRSGGNGSNGGSGTGNTNGSGGTAANSSSDGKLPTNEERQAQKAAFWISELKKEFSKPILQLDRTSVRKILYQGDILLRDGVEFDVDSPLGSSNSTCLHTAVWFRQPELVHWLIAFG